MNQPMLSVIGARQHNLKNVTCELPREKLVVITGPSGSGKSSLAFDTIHAEAYRRYVEFLPSSVRRSIHHLSRPDVDAILGLSPSVAMKQGHISPSPRASVGTITEILDYFRVFFARTATAHCPVDGAVLHAHSVQQIVSHLERLPAGTRLTLSTPILADGTRVEVTAALDSLRERGFARVELNGSLTLLDDVDSNALPSRNELRLVVDRLVIKDGITSRLTDSVELALRQGTSVVLADLGDGEILNFSETLYCPVHNASVPAPVSALFSHQSPRGACPTCDGVGYRQTLDPTRVVPNPRLTLRGGALAVLGSPGSLAHAILLGKMQKLAPLDADVPWAALELPDGYWAQLDELLTQEDGESLDGMLTPRERAAFYRRATCTDCQGTRLRSHRAWFTVDKRTFDSYCAMSLSDLNDWIGRVRAQPTDSAFAAVTPLLEVVQRKLESLASLGLGYLTLNTPLNCVSSGELHRIRLSCLLGTALTGVLYVLDEPTAGLHPMDASLVVEALRKLTADHNSVLAVEHTRTMIEAADWLVDMGPGAGEAGGYLLANGPPELVAIEPRSVTAPHLASSLLQTAYEHTQTPPTEWLTVVGARTANLQALDLKIPTQRLTAITGRSGAGKTSLLLGTLLPAARAALQHTDLPSSVCDAWSGADFTKVVTFDHSPLGLTPRSTPATYTGVWDVIRELFATLPESRARGYKAGRFSFNIKGGRCEACRGEGVQRTQLELVADVAAICSECNGTRFNRETLLPKFRGLSVGDVLALTVDEAQRFFAHLPKANAILIQLQRLGLGYLALGQSAPSLSGGEAQRVRFALELSRQGDGRFLYLFDEPTSGLHFSDVPRVLGSLYALRDAGHTVVAVEHDPEVVKAADWIVELGPGAGAAGGQLVFSGPHSEWNRR